VLAIDTNVVVRLLAGDHPDQSARARALIERHRVLAAAADCDAFITFDQKIAKASEGLNTPAVREP
jgi:predicted nucleic-acid-binding protein